MTQNKKVKDQQRAEHFESVKIQRVDNGYILRIPLVGVKVFTTLDEVFECIRKFYKEAT